MNVDETPIAQIPTPGIHEAQAPYAQPQADLAAASAAAKGLRRFPFVVRIVAVIVIVGVVVLGPLALLIWSN